MSRIVGMGWTIAGTGHPDSEVCWEWQVWRVRERRQIVWGGMQRTGRMDWQVGRWRTVCGMELLWLAEMDEGVTFACGAEAGERMERSVAEVRSATKWNEGILPQAHGNQQIMACSCGR